MKKAMFIILFFILGVLFIGTGIYNCKSNELFWTANITQILSLALTIGVAFWATQYKSDIRKSKEHVEEILRKLQIIVSKEQFYSISPSAEKESVQKTINTTNRKINNYINILLKYGKDLKFKKEIQYIQVEFEKYRERVGDHINDLEYLSKSEDEFRRIAENIDTKCDFIILQLYK